MPQSEAAPEAPNPSGPTPEGNASIASSPKPLTETQKVALQLARSDDPETLIAGYAGVGKTEVLAAASRADRLTPVLAPTNKAASVLRARGIPATTVHSFLYAPAEDAKYKKNKDGTTEYQRDEFGKLILDIGGLPIPIITSTDLKFHLREDAEGSLHRIFVDECSMISTQIRDDLNKCARHIVYFGDRFQLRPVNGKSVFSVLHPNIELTEVHRTAADNPILKLLTSMRTKGFVMPKEWKQDGDTLRVADANNKRLIPTFVDKGVQVICYSNALRHTLNEQIRSYAGLPATTLKAGEKLISLENVRTTEPNPNGGDPIKVIKFYNGEILELAEDVADPGDHYSPIIMKFTNGKRHLSWPFFRKDFWREYEQNNKASWNNNVMRLRATGRISRMPALFDFSGAITGHKAQGSEWPLVAVYHQRATMARNMGPIEQLQWLYTSFGRTRNRLLIVNS